MLVMATHGRVGIKRVIMGSVASEVARAARGPVALIRPDVDSRINLARLTDVCEFGSVADLTFPFTRRSGVRPLAHSHVFDTGGSATN